MLAAICCFVCQMARPSFRLLSAWIASSVEDGHMTLAFFRCSCQLSSQQVFYVARCPCFLSRFVEAMTCNQYPLCCQGSLTERVLHLAMYPWGDRAPHN